VFTADFSTPVANSALILDQILAPVWRSRAYGLRYRPDEAKK